MLGISTPMIGPFNSNNGGLSRKKASMVAQGSNNPTRSPSRHPSPHRIRRNMNGNEDELNSDIMVLISKPNGVNKIDPLRLQKSLASSSESNLTSDYDG